MSGTRLFFAVCLLVAIVIIAAVLLTTTPSAAMPPAPAVGMSVWREQKCEGCHTLYGQGGVYAPDLTHIYAQRGTDYMREFLTNPGAFHPDQRQMPALGLTRSEMDNLLAFLQWVGEQPVAATWPPRPILVRGGGNLDTTPPDTTSNPAVNVSDPVARGKALFSQPPAICSTCHSLQPDVVIVGPSLAGIGARASERVAGQSAEEYLRNSIIRPQAYIVPGFEDVMQKNFGDALSSEQINDLIAFLNSL